MKSYVTCNNENCKMKDSCKRYDKDEETCINFKNICGEGYNYLYLLKKWEVSNETNSN